MGAWQARQMGASISAYPYETPDACPQAVVRQLSPPARMRHRPLVENTTNKVYQKGDKENDGKDASRADAPRLVRLDPRAGVLRAHLEEVCAFVRRADKGDDGLGARGVAVAEEGEGGGFPPLWLLRRRRCRLGILQVLLFFIVGVALVFVGGAIVFRCAARLFLARSWAGRAVLVLENQLPAARDEDRRLCSAPS